MKNYERTDIGFYVFSLVLIVGVITILRFLWDFFYVGNGMPWWLALLFFCATLGVVFTVTNIIYMFIKHR